MSMEMLYFDGCPNHEALLSRLREILARTDKRHRHRPAQDPR
jgi:hypothetical protein